MRVLISGASGLVGTRIAELAGPDVEIVRLVRRPAGEGEVQWDPAAGTLDSQALDGIDAVIHLAGENIGEGRWTAAKKKRILDSRVNGTRLMADAIAKSDHKPALVSASAIGFYGDRGEEELTEESTAGKGFLADVCQQWEAATAPAEAAGARVVRVRLGIVLSSKGGALASMLFPFRMGVGGRMGSGQQFWSWISLDDAASIFLYAAQNEDVAGPVNAVSESPIRNIDFTVTLGRILRRPTLFPMPQFMASIVLGEMSDALIMSSARVLPTALNDCRYRYQHPDLETAIRSAM
ncbi:MAG: TIGR01777 family protein [Planctomycetaceae bacterium]|nr:TIGR01777 family protein [Planctomycetaceae bacterium]